MENFEQPEKEAVSEEQGVNKNLWSESFGVQEKETEERKEETQPNESPEKKKEENKPVESPKSGDSEPRGKKSSEVNPETEKPEDPNNSRLPDAEAVF